MATEPSAASGCQVRLGAPRFPRPRRRWLLPHGEVELAIVQHLGAEACFEEATGVLDEHAIDERLDGHTLALPSMVAVMTCACAGAARAAIAKTIGVIFLRMALLE